MVKTISLLPGVTLRCFPDDRFKQGGLSIQFVRPMRKREAALNALIPAILLRGCETARDLRDITLRLDDLYGATAGALVRRVGDYHCTGLYASFISDRYALDGDRVLEPMVDFLRALLLHPVTENGVFRTDYTESEKKNLISTIESQRNNKRVYASAQLMRHMCRKDSFGIPRLGEVEQVKQITAEGAYAHYKTLLRESPVELFYVGEAEPETVAALLRPVFADMDRAPVTLPVQTPFTACGGGDYTEVMDVAQGKLCMGFTTPVTLRDPAFAAMQVYNTLLGAGMTSKLFVNIREKMSLCYDIGSSFHSTKGILTVSAGIDFSNEDRVKREILGQMDAIRAGDITEAELRCAKEALRSSLRGLHDSPGAIEHYYATTALSGLTWDRDAYLTHLDAVTAEDVARVAAAVRLDTTYFLKGVQ